MKCTKKIFFLILSLAVIIAAFTTVVFAANEGPMASLGTTGYSFEVTTASGTFYYLESEYQSAMDKVAAGGTIKLLTDVTVETGYSFSTKNAVITIDLNGHDFKKFSFRNSYYNAVYDAETETYSKGTTQDANDGTPPPAFTLSASGIEVTIKNSGAPANIYTYSLYRDAWRDSDNVIRGYDTPRSSAAGNGAFLFKYSSSATKTTVTIEGNGITYYGACLCNNTNVNVAKGSTFKINGGTYYAMIDTDTNYIGLINQSGGGTVFVENATFVSNGNPFVNVQSTASNLAFSFKNCNIINGWARNSNTTTGAAGITLEGCRYYATNTDINGTIKQRLTLNGGTLINIIGSNAVIGSGNQKIEYSCTESFNLINESEFILNANAESCDEIFAFTPQVKNYTFNYAVANPSTDFVTVNWCDTAGNVINSTRVLKNCKASAPSVTVPTGDGWRGVTNVTTWLGENDEVSNLQVGEDAEYNFRAVLPAEEDREYGACMTSALFNMNYFTNFAYNVYVPKEEWVEVTNLGGYAPVNTVYINNVEYWVYTTHVASTTALDETEVDLSYVIDGESYSVKFRPSAIYYANTIVNNPESSETEKELVGCLVRYIEESYLAVNNTMSEENQAKLDSFYSVYTPAPYTTEYPDYADSFDPTPFENYPFLIELKVSSSGKVIFSFTLSDVCVQNNYRIKVKGLTSALYTEDNRVFVSNNTPLRTHVMAPFEISMVDENGNTVELENGTKLTMQYSFAAYMKYGGGESSNLAKALYAFGTALREYYPVDETNYQISEITLLGDDLKDYTIAADIDNATEYYVAEELQALLYNKAGYWLEIVPSANADKSIVINLIDKVGGDGFSVTFSEGRIELTCEYEALIHKEAMEFFKDKLSTYGAVNFTSEDSYTKNIRDIYYSDFGAVGDGVTDDSEAIRRAHVYANEIGHTVCADPGATYYIGPMESHITIKTDVNWGTAKFIIDDSIIPLDSAARSVKVFNISGGSQTTYTADTCQAIANINAAGGINASTITKLDLGLGRPVMLQVFNEDHRNFIRHGANANTGAIQHEVILVDAEGNIDPSTPFMFDYEKITKIIVCEIDTTPITINGGIFTTYANSPEASTNTAYARNIQVSRPNTTVKNVTHKIEREGDTGAAYDGFLRVHLTYNVTFDNCVYTGHKIYTNSSGTQIGNYDISATSSINIRWIDCDQTNFFRNESTGETTEFTRWGVMVSSYCKNLSFDGCRLSRFDAHAGIYNVSIKNSTLINITIDGGGTAIVENTTIYNKEAITLRKDYGSFWHGDIILRNITFQNVGDNATGVVNLIDATWYYDNHDYGYPTPLPTNITADGVNVATNAEIRVFKNTFVTGTTDIANGNSSMTAPEKITVANTNGYTVVFPDKTLYPFFANTEYSTTISENPAN